MNENGYLNRETFLKNRSYERERFFKSRAVILNENDHLNQQPFLMNRS
jgi:hypothetical protein